MNTLFVGLSVAGAAAAQVVNGYSMVSLASDGSYYGSSAPPQVTAYGSVTTDASYSEYTAPPSQTTDFYSIMPYESMTSGGYSSLECGYGYYKSDNGYCMQESWVSTADSYSLPLNF